MNVQTIDAGKAYAALLLRLGVGIVFTFFALQKLFAYPDIVHTIASGFVGKFHPFFLIQAFLYPLPFIEIVGGLLLIIGYKHRLILFIMGLVMIILIVGVMILKNSTLITENMIFLIAISFCLYNSNNDIFRMGTKMK